MGGAAALWPQAAPSGTGPRQFGIEGTLKYALRYSQMEDIYSSGQGVEEISTLSGDIDFRTASERHPFTVTFNGGYNWRLGGTRSNDGFFESLDLHQAFVGEHWNLNVGDSTVYRKQLTGDNGQPGTGEPIGNPNPNPPDQGVFALNTVMVSNNVYGKFNRQITSALTFNSDGDYFMLRYPNGDAIENTRYRSNSGITWRLNGRSSIQAIYGYNHFYYTGYDLSITANGAMGGFLHRWTPHLETTMSAGPQWVSSSNFLLEPSELTYQAYGFGSYTMKRGVASVTYVRNVAGGSGFVLGSTLDTVEGNLQRKFRDRWTAEAFLGYRRIDKLSGAAVVQSKIAGAQVSKPLGRRFTVYANYTAIFQSHNALVADGALNGLWQRVSIGAGFTPPAIHLGR